MKKILSLLALVLMSCMGAWAQTTTSYPSTLKGNKVYTITSNTQGGLTVNAAKTQLYGTDQGTDKSTDTHANHFAFIQKDGNYYLYNILTYKYVDLTTNKGTLVDSPTTPVYFKSESDGTVMIYGDDNHIINLGGSKQITIDTWGGPNYGSSDGRNKKDNGNSFTITEAESMPYYVVCNKADGGVVYNETTYKNGETFTISGDNYISESVVSAVSVAGYDATITFDGAKVNVAYSSGVAQDYTIESGTKSISEILTEVTDLRNIIVKSGATLNIDQNIEVSRVQPEDGATLAISYASYNIAAITGAVNVVLDVNYTLSGIKSTQATGKLTVNSGKTFTFGGGDTETNSVASFTSVDVNGTLYYQNKTSVWNNVTFNDGSILQSYDMGAPGSNKDNGIYENSFHLAGTTTVNGEVYVLSNWNAQYTIDKLAGAGTLRLRGNGKTNGAAAEPTYYTISDVEDFTGALDVQNTQAYIMPINGIKITNAVKVNTATLNNVTIVGTERINTAGNVTINGVASNDLTNSSYGYAFVGAGTINLAGTMDLTKNGTSNHSRVGYGAGTHVNILADADVTTAGVFNSSTAASNTDLTIGAGATLTTTDKTSSPNFTNNGTIKLVDLSATRYTATTVSGTTFNVAVSEELLSAMTSDNYTVVDGVTTCNVGAFTLNGQEEVVVGSDHFRVYYNEGEVILTKLQIVEYTVTYTTDNNHSWVVNGRGLENSTLDINDFAVDFYDNLAFDGSDLELREDNKTFVITCDEDFPFEAGKYCRISDVLKNHDLYVKSGSETFTYQGTSTGESLNGDIAYWDGEVPANSNIWCFEHIAGTQDAFLVKNYLTGKYLTFQYVNNGRCIALMEAAAITDATVDKTSVMRVRKSTATNKGENGFVLQHPKYDGLCCSVHIGNDTPEPKIVSSWKAATEVDALANATNTLCILPLNSYSANLAATDGTDHYGSIYLPYTMTFPEGVEAYAAAQDGEVLKLTKVGGAGDVVPEGAYILYGGTSVTSAVLALGADATVSAGSNALTGKFEANVALPEGNNYVLNDKNNVVGFYKYTRTTYPVAKAVFCAGTTASSASFAFRFEDVLTAIDALHSNNSNAEIYDLQGRRLNKAQQGMNIINGHKVLVK